MEEVNLESLINNSSLEEIRHSMSRNYFYHKNISNELKETNDFELIKRYIELKDPEITNYIIKYVKYAIKEKILDIIDSYDDEFKKSLLSAKDECSSSILYRFLDDPNTEISNKARTIINGTYLFMHDYYHYHSKDFKFDNLYYILFINAYYSDKGKKILSQMGYEKAYDVHMLIHDLTNGPHPFLIRSEFDKSLYHFALDYESHNKPQETQELSKLIISLFPQSNKKSSSLNVKKGEDINLDKYLDQALSVSKKDVKNSDFVDKKNIKKSSLAILNCNNTNILKDIVGDSDIEYGEYPQDNVSASENELLEMLYSFKALEMTKKNYEVNNFLDNVRYDEYKVNDRKFIRVGYKDYIEVSPILWHLDDNLLVSNQAIFTGSINKEFLKKFFDESIMNNKQKSDKFSDNKLDHDDLIQAKKMIDEEKQDKIKELESQMLNMLDQIKVTSEMYEQLSNKKMGKRVMIDNDLLLVKVDDHIEFNEKYIPYLKYIDLSIVSSENLKVSGIDFSETNIVINPQAVYNKDLSNSTFDNNNLIFASFDGCNLSGANLEKEKESLIFDNAIIDDATRLPENVNNMSNQL